MEDLIKKIIKVDKEARKKTQESKQQLAESKIAIAQRKKDLEMHYNQSVEEIIALTTEEETAKVNAKKEEIDTQFAAADKLLDEAYQNNKDNWENELFERVIQH